MLIKAITMGKTIAADAVIDPVMVSKNVGRQIMKSTAICGLLPLYNIAKK